MFDDVGMPGVVIKSMEVVDGSDEMKCAFKLYRVLH